ncbi:MAG: amino acid permease, partial [Candidatus Scatosoma sp.]
IIIAIVYIVYFIGLAGVVPVETLKDEAQGAPVAFLKLFGRFGGTVLNVFVVVSCLGTLNGLMLATTRGMFAIAARGQGPKPEVLQELSPHTNMPVNSSVIGLLVCALWMFYFYGANLTAPVFGLFSFDSSELPVISSYAFYIPIFVIFMVKHGKENKGKNIVLPIFGIIACLFMLFSAVYAHGIVPFLQAKENGEFSFPVLFYLIVFAAIMAFGAFFYRKNAAVNEIVAWDDEPAEGAGSSAPPQDKDGAQNGSAE